MTEEEQALLEQELIEGDVEETPTPVDAKITLQRILADQAAQRELQKQALAEELKDRIAKRTTNIDFTPLAAQLDSLFGGKASQQAAQSAYAQGAEDDAGIKERYDQLLSIAGKPGGADAAAIKLLQNEKEFARKGKSSDARLQIAQNSEIKKDFDKVMDKYDKERKVIDEAEKSMTALEDAFASGDPERVNGALGTFATFINGNKGAQSDSDVARQMQPTIEQTLQLIQKKFTGKPAAVDPESYKNMMEAVRVARATIGGVSRTKLTDLGKAYSTGPRRAGFNQAIDFVKGVENAADELKKPKRTLVSRKEAAGTKPADGGLDPAKKARLEELRAKKAAGKI